MEQKILDILYKTADEFGKIARRVNESSRKRKNYSQEAINYINLSMEIEEELNEDLKSVSKSNIEHRNQDTIVLNTCKILTSNMEMQKKVLNELLKKNSLKKETLDLLSSKVDALSESLAEALKNIQEIIEKDNKIILQDNIILKRKQFQQDAILELKELANTSLKDAEKAIAGSSSNLDRGLEMVERFKMTEKYLEEKNEAELKNLIAEANKGWNIAVTVNESSNSQFEFAEKVNEFTQQLHKDSVTIKEMVVEKHHVFENSLQLVTVLTVILSIKLKKYLDIEDVIDSLEFSSDIRDHMIELITGVKIACRDIKEVTALNYDMTDSSHLNNAVEDNALKCTKKEVEYFENIKKEVELMTDATKYPVEGSSKNISNGKLLEESLRKIISESQQ